MRNRFWRSRSVWLAALSLIGLLSFTGCGADGPPTTHVTGTVLYQGQPVPDATVLFSRGSRNIAQGEMAIGQTDSSGRFELTTHMGSQTDAKGALVGEYEVTISKHVPPPGVSESQYRAMVETANQYGEKGEMVPANLQPPELVEMFPARYSVLGQSELRANVTAEGPNDFRFELE